MAKINSYLRQLKGKQVEVRGDPTSEIPAGKFPSDLGTDKKRLCVAIQPTPLASLYEYWCKIVETYSNKKLTVDMDNLPAIHGIAQALHKSRMADQAFEECYYNGVWTTDFTRELLWIGEPGQPSLDHIVTNSIILFTDLCQHIPGLHARPLSSSCWHDLQPSAMLSTSIPYLTSRMFVHNGWIESVQNI
jgi:hypothetical protein